MAKYLKAFGAERLKTSSPSFNVGLIFIIIGGLLVYAGFFWMSDEKGALISKIMAGLFLAGALILLAYRDRTIFSLKDRSYFRQKGFFWSVKIISGSFEEFLGVKIVDQSSSRHSYSGYLIMLTFKLPERKDIQLGQCSNEETAQREAREIAASLKVEYLG